MTPHRTVDSTHDDANNLWKPYVVCNSCGSRIAGYSANYDMWWAGLATVTSNSGSHLGTVDVKFDEVDVVGESADLKHHLACQENGHAGGLDHRTTAVSCMYQNVSAEIPDFDSHDTQTMYNYNNHSD